MVLISVHEDI